MNPEEGLDSRAHRMAHEPAPGPSGTGETEERLTALLSAQESKGNQLQNE